MVLLVGIAFSGCFGDDGASPAQASGTTAAASDTAAPDANQSIAPNSPPTANLTASVMNGSAPLNVTFTLNGTDADGDLLSWTLDVDAMNGTQANGTGLPASVNLTFELEGNFTAILNVTDGQEVASANLTIVVASGVVALPAPVSATDAGGDSTVPFTDTTSLTVSMTEEAIIGVLSVDTLWPTTAVLTPVSYSFAINTMQFDSFARYPIDANPMTWDGAAYMAAGTSTWSGDKVTFTIPLAYLAEKKIVAPYKFHGAANFGGLLETVEDDRVPDSGDLTFGP